MSAAEKSSIPGSWPGGSSDLPLITVHSQFIVHLSAIASSLWGLFPLLLRAVGDPPSSRDPLQRGKFRRRKRSLRLSQEKGEPLLKADSGPEDVPCTDALMEQRGLINGQANNEGTMNGRTSWGGMEGFFFLNGLEKVLKFTDISSHFINYQLSVKVSTVKTWWLIVKDNSSSSFLKRGQLVDAKLSQYVRNNEKYAMLEKVTFVPVSTWTWLT